MPSDWSCLPLNIYRDHSLTLLCFLLQHHEILQIRWLKLTQIYYLVVSVGQECGHGLAGSSPRGLTRLHPRCRWATVSPAAQQGRPASKLPHIVAEFLSLQLWNWGPMPLLAIIWELLSTPRGHPQFLAMCPLPRPSHNLATYFLKQAREKSLSSACEQNGALHVP